MQRGKEQSKKKFEIDSQKNKEGEVHIRLMRMPEKEKAA